MMPFFYRLNLLSISSFFLYLFSLLIIGFSYQSFEPYIVISTLSFIFISITYLLCGRNNFDDFISTLLIFTVCLFWSSVSSIYLNVFNDSQYFGADSGFFLELSKGERFENPILFGSNFYDGIGAVNFWKVFYDFFYSIGFGKYAYIGITINTIFVSLTGLFSLKMVKLIYPSDNERYFRYLFLFSSCFLLLLFASLHLRDAFVLFFVTLQCFGWIKFINQKNLINFILLSLITLTSSYALLYLRAEFTALSLGFGIAFAASFILTNSLSKINKYFLYLTFGSVVSIVVLFISNNTSVFSDLINASELYSKAPSESDSLGFDLIISQPIPIRLILGSILLFVMPIPFWSGIGADSIYFLFKSLNAVYFYFFLPLIFLSFLNFSVLRKTRTATNYFLLFCILGFTSVVVLTSSENRHIGSFLPIFFLFALIPNFYNKIEIKNYVTLFLLFLSFMLFVHSIWILLRYL